ncbi:exodeoxyribonuclease VII large subunit [Macrococcoides caseolyticum]|uniref:exodeoxyribonuclease VII large subunit n=1 Tax=Macrococcoides caseolyticum TaxID=69966 RepID=UPI001F28789C|nr:exodeoxyribonuclease VII large subunit [Macrococcus caseolyticus]MCE4956088.1 exodeoxyribonuclease VII large subunit [Macrococcus caseolyticus]
MEKYLTVTALSQYIKTKFDRDPYLQQVFIKGELSNYKKHSSGHHYFALKDNGAIIQCMMFSRDAHQLTFSPKEGDSVLITGRVSTYESRGNYQLYVSTMTLDGIGLLYEKFEQLKKDYLEKGYFNAEHKKPLPQYPKHIAVLTASTGAAVQDIRTTLTKRYPIAQVTYISTLVQGVGAKEDIVKNIQYADTIGADVIIVGRGGGSIEDLWAFNESIVVEAIYHAKTPIISAVGHETDTTLADYVADFRAPTPTGAAVLATPDSRELMNQIVRARAFIDSKINTILRKEQQRLQQQMNYYIFKNPYVLVEQKVQRIDEVQHHLKLMNQSTMQNHNHRLLRMKQQLSPKVLIDKVQQSNIYIDNLQNRIERTIHYKMSLKQSHLQSKIALLSTLSPTETLLRGYSIARTDGQIVNSTLEVTIGQTLEVEMKDGKLVTEVIEKKH